MKVFFFFLSCCRLASAGCDAQNIKHLWKFNPSSELDTGSFWDVTTTVRPRRRILSLLVVKQFDRGGTCSGFIDKRAWRPGESLRWKAEMLAADKLDVITGNRVPEGDGRVSGLINVKQNPSAGMTPSLWSSSCASTEISAHYTAQTEHDQLKRII